MNTGKIILAFIVLLAAAAAAVYLMGQFPQTRPLYTQITGFLGTAKDKVMGLLTNPIGAVTAAGTAIAGVTGIAALWSKLSAAKTQITQVKDSADNTINSLKNEKEQLTSQFTEQAKNQATGYEAQIADYKKQLEATAVDTAEIAKIKTQAETQVQTVQDMHNNFVAQLTSGAQTVIDPATNQTYKLITLEKTVVK